MTETATAPAATKKAKTEITSVTMDDGRVVDFPGKRRLLKESIFLADGTVQIRMDFRNGETRLFTVPTGLLARFAAHGAEQKLGDETAGLDDIDDAVLAVDELMDRLAKGEWAVRKEGAGLGGTSVLLRALIEAYPTKTKDELRNFLSPKTQAEKLALRESSRLKPIIARLEAEKAQKGPKIDTEALLGGLEG